MVDHHSSMQSETIDSRCLEYEEWMVSILHIGTSLDGLKLAQDEGGSMISSGTLYLIVKLGGDISRDMRCCEEWRLARIGSAAVRRVEHRMRDVIGNSELMRSWK
ncbi:hypothetical protein Tco_1272137 [Tanacetum coccineum]